VSFKEDIMKSIGFVLALATVALWAGCSDQSTQPAGNTAVNQEQTLPADYAPLLDSLDVLTEMPRLTPSGSTADSGILPAGNYVHYKVQVVWGNLDNNITEDSNAWDWSGALTLHFEGGVFPDSVIDFEPGQDSILVTNAIHFVPWVSLTDGDFDGILFDVYYNTDICYFAAPKWEFVTRPFRQEWTYDRLNGMDTVYQVDNINQVWVKTWQVSEPPCPKGYVAGAWVNKDRDNGYFFGHWMNDGGMPTGYVLGKFWTENVGGRVLKGIRVSSFFYVDGYLFGEWKYADENGPSTSVLRASEGVFRARYTDRNWNVLGSVEGKFGLPWPWSTAAQQNGQRSYFKGQWVAYCPTAVAE
jgi:hypothetical protein